MDMFLVEYEMLWAGKVTRTGIEEVEAHFSFQAENTVRERLKKLNKKAEIKIIETVRV